MVVGRHNSARSWSPLVCLVVLVAQMRFLVHELRRSLRIVAVAQIRTVARQTAEVVHHAMGYYMIDLEPAVRCWRTVAVERLSEDSLFVRWEDLRRIRLVRVVCG